MDKLGIVIEVEGELVQLACFVQGEYVTGTLTLEQPVEFAQDIGGPDAERLLKSCKALTADAGCTSFELVDPEGVLVLHG
jgi:hypothetical protein